MSRVFFFLVFLAAVILFFGLAQILLLRKLNPEWWHRKWIRRAARSLPLSGVVFLVVFVAGEYYQLVWMSLPASIVTVLSVVLELALMLALPVSGAIHFLNRWLDRRPRSTDKADTGPQENRRLFLKSAAAAVPMVTLATGVTGVGGSFADIRVYRRRLAVPGLPRSLDGLRILQVSDTHLRHYVSLDDLEQLVTDARPFSPELVLITGDVADDLRQLPDAIAMVNSLNPVFGSYAIMGNHEYYRGPEKVKRIFAASPTPLLINQSRSIVLRGHPVFLGGIDDPVRLGGLRPGFFENALDETLSARSTEDFTIVMSHRPDAFPYAASRSVNVTLSGHTHGGQVGIFGRSVLEPAFPEKFLWGEYSLGESRLYTTCGAGHWFPFRLGCPAEAPVIELTSA